MTFPSTQAYLQELVTRQGWRELGKGYEYLDLHQGVILHAVEFRDELTLLFRAPGASVTEGAHVKKFSNWSGAGLPSGWLQPRPGDDSCCVLRLDRDRLNEAGTKRALLIPDLIAQDFHAHGAARELLCQNCRQTPAVSAALVQGAYSHFCGPCWDEVRARAAGDKDKVGAVFWSWALPLLILGSVAGALLWGQLRYQLAGAAWLFLVPLLYGWAMCALVLGAARGVNNALRVVLFAAVLLVVLAGNLWAYRAEVLVNNPRVTWLGIVNAYVGVQLPRHPAYELPHFIGGLLGTWFGLAWLKPHTQNSVR